MYGAEVWQIPTTEINKMLSTEMDVLRRSVQAAMTTRNLEPNQWRNREEWRLVSGIRRQLL
jgi:hypothetical protein